MRKGVAKKVILCELLHRTVKVFLDVILLQPNPEDDRKNDSAPREFLHSLRFQVPAWGLKSSPTWWKCECAEDVCDFLACLNCKDT